MYIKLTLLSLLFQDFLFDNAASAVWMPDCSKEKNMKKPQCVCKNPANWDMEVCQDFWKKPEVVANTESRIVGGVLAPRDAYPWFARLVRRNGSWWGCGGMLIAKEYVLTAAHCVRSSDASSLAVQIGAVCPTTTSNNCGQPIQTINVASVQQHPQYNSGTLDNDFALLKLVSRANADPVPMDQGNVVDNYSNNKSGLYAIGFGSLSSGGNVASELRHVELAFVPRNTCNSNYNGGISNVMMCAADPGQDSCQGDSGGPLYDQANNALVGVVSWGYGCADPNYPGVYAQVSSRFDWIKSNTCGLSNHSNPQPDYCSNTPTAPTPTAPTPTAPTPTAPTPTAPTPTAPSPTVSIPPIALRPCGNNNRRKRFAVSMNTDQYGLETSVAVYRKNRRGDFSRRVFYRAGFPSETTSVPHKCLPSRFCYKIVVGDTYGDGMCCGFGSGSFQGYFDGSAIPNVDNVFDSGFESESEEFGNC